MVSFNFKKLKEKYLTDPTFNKSVNVFRQLIEEYGFSPREIREGLFLAQYMYEMDHVTKYLYTQKEVDERMELIAKLRDNFVLDAEKIIAGIK